MGAQHDFKVRCTFLGGPEIRITVFWGSAWGSPYLFGGIVKIQWLRRVPVGPVVACSSTVITNHNLFASL